AYEEEERFGASTGAGKLVGLRVKTWQRQWGGGRLQHGDERLYLGNKLVEVHTYKNGELHGPFRLYDENYVWKDGQFVQGAKEGAWRWLNRSGQERSRTEYRAGKLVRAASEDQHGNQHIIEIRDDQGKPRIVVDGLEIEDRLASLAAEGLIDDKRLREALRSPVDIEFAETPLKAVVAFMGDIAEISLVLDPHHVDADRPISGTFHELPFSIAMAVLTGPRESACDYRFGMFWVTSAEDVKNWHDPTGVADIVPHKDSQLARSWNEPVVVRATEQPLGVVLAKIAQPLAIEIDTDGLVPLANGKTAYPVTWISRGQQFRHALGLLLYQSRCRCELRGEVLVILPPE